MQKAPTGNPKLEIPSSRRYLERVGERSICDVACPTPVLQHLVQAINSMHEREASASEDADDYAAQEAPPKPQQDKSVVSPISEAEQVWRRPGVLVWPVSASVPMLADNSANRLNGWHVLMACAGLQVMWKDFAGCYRRINNKVG
jgi:hypothetical protein